MYFDEPNGVIVQDTDPTLAITGGVMALAVSPLGYFSIGILTAITAKAAQALF
jgi:hypothetical protein